MKMTFNSWYVTIISGSGLVLMALAMIGYVTGLTQLLIVGVIFFAVACVVMTSVQAQRQHNARQGATK